MMKRLTLLVAALLLTAHTAYAQARLTPPKGATLPVNCNTGDLFTKTTVTAGLYVCTATNTWSTDPLGAPVTGAGLPAGATGTLQYNAGSGNFGATAISWVGSSLTTSQTGPFFKWSGTSSTLNGTWQLYGGSATNEPTDPRPDDIFSIGWNADHSVAGAGGVRWVFESHCGPAVGCSLPGQSETYLAAYDGVVGHDDVRVMGVFQTQDPDAPDSDTRVIYRASSFGWFSQDQVTPLFSLNDNQEAVIQGSLTAIAPLAEIHGNWLFQDGQSLIRSDTVGVAVAPTSSVKLGGTGDNTVSVVGNHFSMASTDITDASANVRIRLGAGSATNFPALGGSGTDDIILQPVGSTTDIQMTLQSKGTGSLYLNPGGTLRINGGVGVTASGTSCTITAITKGIITGATCTP